MRHPGFNPKARWDRHIPETDADQAAPCQLNDKIEVLARFSGARILPQSFFWNNKEYCVKKTNYIWRERQGQEIIIYFSVDTGTNLYQLSFNNTSFSWRLVKLIA